MQFEALQLTRGSATTHGTPHRYDTHVPLILLGPGIPAGRVHDRVNSVDLAPTLAELAGIPGPAEIDGRSLVRDLENVRMVLDEEELVALDPVVRSRRQRWIQPKPAPIMERHEAWQRIPATCPCC